MASKIAQMSFRGGGTFLPARSPYDRQVLIEYVTQRVRFTGEVQVLLDGQRWLVRGHRGWPVAYCTNCGNAADPTCYAPTNSQSGYCATCALGAETPPAPSQVGQGQVG